MHLVRTRTAGLGRRRIQVTICGLAGKIEEADSGWLDAEQEDVGADCCVVVQRLQTFVIHHARLLSDEGPRAGSRASVTVVCRKASQEVVQFQ